MEQLTAQRERQRKFLLILPLLILPFLTLFFWALGGGKGVQAQAVVQQKGINTDLPEAQLSDEPQTKLSLYDRAEKDSVRSSGHDPLQSLAAKDSSSGISAGHKASANEAAINERLARIKQQLAQPSAMPVSSGSSNSNSAEVERLEKMMRALQSKPAADPQMQQLSGMLDKIIAIQNPSAVAQVNSQAAKPDSAFQAIPALIDGTQKVAPGAAVSLVLRDSVRLNGVLLPRGQKLSGLCAVTNQRLLLDIRNIRLGTSIIPVNLTVYSLDGLTGIPAPEAELGEAAGNGTANALSNMQFLSMDQGLGAQAATAGISAATGLLSKKARKIRIKLHGGVTVLLRNNDTPKH